jgi:hypothetical protein
MNFQKIVVEENKPKEQPSKLETWLDNTSALERLSISGRTLARWRQKKIISFARIGGKLYYRESDVEALFVKYWQNQL